MARKKHFLVLDTETCGTIESPLPYDIGWVITDRQGNIYEERSFIVSEIFLGKKDLMKSAYFAEKIPQYWEDIKSGTRTVLNALEIRKIMLDDIRKYKVYSVGAYNTAFDKKALNNLIKELKGSLHYWFPYLTNYFCIWNMACDVILNRTTYIQFAERNGLISNLGNIQTGAEMAFKYITDSIDFVESHTGLEDVKIEVQIMAECFRQHKKMDCSINPNCWRKVQKKRKELQERVA